MKNFTYFIITIFLSTLIACKPNNGVVTENSARTDSIFKLINTPELKAINAKIIVSPSDANLYNERAKLYLKYKQFEEAINDAKRCIRIDSTNAEYYLTQADVFFSANETKNCKDVLEKITTKFPTNTDGLLKLGELYYFVKQYELAFAKINQALKLNENLTKAYSLKGNIYKETGDTAKAISSFETALEQDNKNFAAFLDLGLIYGARKNLIALEYYDNAISMNPLSTEALYAKAKLLQDLNKLDEATVLYNRILKNDTQHAFSLYNLGAIEFSFKSNTKNGLDYFTKAINANPRYVEAYYARGACYQELKDNANASADYQMCLQLQPNYPPAVDGLNSIGK
jgi:tetratricopeptide (TPR) repeat protein